MITGALKNKKNEMGMLLILLALWGMFSLQTDSFFTISNLQQISKQCVELGFMTLGMSACIISGGFDLSIGAIVGLNSILIATMLQNGMEIGTALWVSAVCSIMCGALNGLLIGCFQMQPMVITLGTSAVFTGIGTVISKGHAISGLPEKFLVFHTTEMVGIPLQFWIFIVGVVCFIVIFHRSKFGREVYLIGSNYDVAYYSGLPCKRNIFLVYIFSACMAFLVAVIMTSRMATGRIDFADNYVMQSVSAAVIGGISVYGGKGKIYGAIIGVLIFTVLSNAFNLLELSRYLHQIVVGVILLIVLGIRRKIIK